MLYVHILGLSETNVLNTVPDAVPVKALERNISIPVPFRDSVLG